MTRTRLILWLLPALAACPAPEAFRAIPQGQLYFPTGMIHAPGQTAEGVLFVASSNFDQRYTRGRLTGIDLASLSCGVAPAGACLPAFPAPAAPAIDIPGLGTIDEKDIASLAGDLDGVQMPGSGPFRILVPSRAEGSFLQVVDTAGERMTCLGEGATADCSVGAISLEANRLSGTGLPRAPAPFSVAISPSDGDTFITSLQAADSPANSQTNFSSYLVRLNAFTPAVTDDSFVTLGLIPTNSVALGRTHAFVSGRAGLALRLIDRHTEAVLPASVETNFNNLDTRDLALGRDESRLYLLSRGPDALLVLRNGKSPGGAPLLSLGDMALLPLGASQVRVVQKPSGGDLALVTCLGTQSFDAVGSAQGSLLVWDEASGRFVAELGGFGFQPYGLAVQTIGQGARLYVGLFGEGRIAVVDVPDRDRPEELRLVARLGTSHACLVNPSARPCAEISP